MAHFNVLMHCISDMFPGWSLDFESTWDFMQPDHSWTFFQIAKIICFDAQLNLNPLFISVFREYSSLCSIITSLLTANIIANIFANITVNVLYHIDDAR